MKVLLLVPQSCPGDRHESVRNGTRPQADYDAVAEAVRAIRGGRADILDRNSVEQEGGWLVRLVRRLAGINWALALLGYQRCRGYDAVMTQSEVVGLPFAFLAATLWRRPRLVTTAFYLDGRRNAAWYRVLRIHNCIDTIFVLGREQYDIGRLQLGLPEGKLAHLDTCGYIDTAFFAATPPRTVNERQICSVGLEFRDFPTLIKAMAGLPDIKLKLDPASPWSLHQSKVGDLSIPPNVEICHMAMGTVRSLYAESAAVVIPLLPNAIGAGRTTLVEAMAMGKPVIITKSKDNTYAGRPDIIDGENVILVNQGDGADMRRAIERLIGDAELRRHIGANARRWAQEHAGRQQWLDVVVRALSGQAGLRNVGSEPQRENCYARGNRPGVGLK